MENDTRNSASPAWSFSPGRWLQSWKEPVHAAPFVVLRMVFGFLMLAGTLRFLWLGWVEDHYIRPLFHFRYYGFEWVPIAPGWALYAIHILMLGSALLLMTGYLYRWAAVFLFLTFTYTELIDLTYYLNHYYFVSLACLLFCLAPEPVATPGGPEEGTVPKWTIGMFKLLLSLVYIYAGVAKINSDWLLDALPLKIWLPANDTLPLIGPLLTVPATAYLFSWCGMLYDCFIVFFLSWPLTRIPAYLTVIFFHGITGAMFQIGVFPVVMIGATLVFFSENWHRNRLQALRKAMGSFLKKPAFRNHLPGGHTGNRIPGFLILFFTFQFLFPWRYLLYPGNLFWTEEGYRFSWRVMLMEKAGTALFYVKDSKTDREGVVDNSRFLNAHQEKQMAMQPDMILQFAHFLGKHYAEKGVQSPQVRAEVWVTLNGKPSRLLIDEKQNLMSLRDGWQPKTWIRHYED